MSLAIVSMIAGPVLHAKRQGPFPLRQSVRVGPDALLGEVVRIHDDQIVVQVYEDTMGLRPGVEVHGDGQPLAIRLGPGLLGRIFDGLLRPLSGTESKFVQHGMRVAAAGANRSVSTPRGTVCSCSGSTSKSSAISAADDDDTFTIRAFVKVDPNDPKAPYTNINGGQGADFIAFTVNAPVRIDGGDGFDTLTVIGTEFGDDFVVNDQGVYGAGLFVTYTGLEQIVVDALEGYVADDLWPLPTYQEMLFIK